jgi:hypothetical protein
MKSLFALVLLLGLSATAQAQSDARITILDYGIVTGTVGKDVRAPGTATGVTREVTNFKLVRQTETIVARQGVRFGIRYRLDGVPRDKVLKAKCITRFPAGGVTTPKGENVTADEFDCELEGGDANWRSYTFDEAWELVPGDWVMEFWYGGQKIGEKRFAVTLP